VRPNRVRALRARVRENRKLLQDFDKARDRRQWDEPWRSNDEGLEISERINYHSTPLGEVRFGLADDGESETANIETLVDIASNESATTGGIA